MGARLVILAGFASAIILGALALKAALTVEVGLKPLTPQNRDSIAELGEAVRKRAEEQAARREARARGEVVPEPAAEPFPRDAVIAMMAGSDQNQEEMQQILAELEPRATPSDGRTDIPELDEVTQLGAITYAHEVQRLLTFDANGDGVLDRAELERSVGKDMPPIRSPFRKPDEILAEHDLNKDGLVSRDELIGSYRDPLARLTQDRLRNAIGEKD